MHFTSPFYLFFLIGCFVVYWALPSQARKPWLIFGSYLFYATWGWPFVLLLFSVSLFNWAYGRWVMYRYPTGLVLATGVAANLGVLIYYKYLPFLLGNLGVVAGAVGVSVPSLPSTWLVPLGVSFFTFQGVAYLVDVACGEAPFERLLDYLLYKGFWPQLIAGPIIRPGEIREQIEQPRSFDPALCGAGCRRILAGLFKKLVLADALAVHVEALFRATGQASALDSVIGVLGFGLQIYFDFSAYSDIAIGSAMLFGFGFPENFDWPYLARSPQEFWNRWHLTLSRWIRDYLFTPMAFAMRDRPVLNRLWPLAAMAVCGLWHGPSWTFVCWGLWHGALLVLQRTALARLFAVPAEDRPGWASALRGAMATVLTFACVQVGWLFFRAESFAQIAQVLEAMATGRGGWTLSVLPPFAAMLVGGMLLGVAILPRVIQARAALAGLGFTPERWLPVARPLLDACLLHAILLFGQTPSEFVYFKF